MKSLLARCAAALLFAGVVTVPSVVSAEALPCETPKDVPIVLEFGTLDGDDRILCAQDAVGTVALDALHELGVDTQDSSGAMPMVCRIDGLPTKSDEKCGNALDGKGYWAFMVATEGADWNYASVGLQEYELKAGDFVALKYHLMSDGDDVAIAADPDGDTRAAAQAPKSADDSKDGEDDGPSFAAIALPVAVAAVVLVAVAAFVVRRRRA